MRLTAPVLIALACTLAALISCSPCLRTADGQAVPERIMGVYRTYPDTVAFCGGAPEGYEPLHISHYGRHGSRHLLYDSQYVFVHDILSRAASDGKLTRVGKRVCRDFLKLYPQFAGHAGELTSVGVSQQRAIARRMVRNYASLFDDDATVKASTSATSRTTKSMDAFCTQLQKYFPSLPIERTTDAVLNPYSSQSGIPTGYDLKVKSPQAEWRADYAVFCRRKIATERFVRQIFPDTDYAEGCCDLTAFMQNIFHLAIHFRGCGVGTDWLRLFTLDELWALAQCDAYTFYMEKGPARQTSDRTWALSAHILKKMIQDADRDLSDGTTANLRFGHDGCIMALLTLMEADGWTQTADTQDQIARAWDVSQIPMACNLQWIFFRPATGEGEILVRLLLNETPLRLCVTDKDGLCRWRDLKQYLEGRCNIAFAILNQN